MFVIFVFFFPYANKLGFDFLFSLLFLKLNAKNLCCDTR